MARVTVEDCVDKVDNRFELVVLAGQRAREINAGASICVERDDDKNTVVSLREISEDCLEMDQLREGLVKSLQRCVENEERETLPQLEDSSLEMRNESEEMLRRLTPMPQDGPMMRFEDMPLEQEYDD